MALKAGRVGVKPSEITKGGKIKGGGGSPYVLPVANATTLGGVKPVAKTEAMTKQVGVDSEGRLYTEPSGGGGGASVDDIVYFINNYEEAFLVPFYTSAADPSGYTLSYSSQQGDSVPAWAVFNSIIEAVTSGATANARWTSSQTLPQWVQIELPVAKKINSFYFANNLDGGVSFCKTYKVQGSNDNSTFTDLFEETIENTAISKVVALSNESAEYKYYRIVVTDSYNNAYSGLTSFFPMYIDIEDEESSI